MGSLTSEGMGMCKIGKKLDVAVKRIMDGQKAA